MTMERAGPDQESYDVRYIHQFIELFHNTLLVFLSPGNPFNTSKTRTFIIEGTLQP